MREDNELMFSFRSSALEKLGTVSCPDIQCMPDSYQEISPILVSPDVTRSGNEYGVNIPSANSSFPLAEIDNSIIYEIVNGDSICEEETKGIFTPSYKEWESVTKVEDDHIRLSKDWTNLFSMKMEGVIICVLCFKFHKINKSRIREKNSCFFRAKAICKFSNCLEFTFFIRNNPLEYHAEDSIVIVYSIRFSILSTFKR